MVHYIIIRESNLNDIHQINDLIRNAYISNVTTSWLNALMKEITFQLIVTISAVMFIFVGVPLFYCITAIPLVLLLIFITIYSSLLMKSVELANKTPMQCWIAEVLEPRYFMEDPRKLKHLVMTEEELKNEEINLNSYRRKIVGTIAVRNSLSFNHSLWLYRLAVDKSYRRKGIGSRLVKIVQKWGLENRYDRIHLATTECQEQARHLFAKAGFEMKQMYHKQIIGNVVMLVMYQLEYMLKSSFNN